MSLLLWTHLIYLVHNAKVLSVLFKFYFFGWIILTPWYQRISKRDDCWECCPLKMSINNLCMRPGRRQYKELDIQDNSDRGPKSDNTPSTMTWRRMGHNWTFKLGIITRNTELGFLVFLILSMWGSRGYVCGQDGVIQEISTRQFCLRAL